MQAGAVDGTDGSVDFNGPDGTPGLGNVSFPWNSGFSYTPTADQAYSIEAWYMVTDPTNTSRTIFSAVEPSNVKGVSLVAYEDRVVFQRSDNFTATADHAFSHEPYRWYHVVATFDPDGRPMRLYHKGAALLKGHHQGARGMVLSA